MISENHRIFSYRLPDISFTGKYGKSPFNMGLAYWWTKDGGVKVEAVIDQIRGERTFEDIFIRAVHSKRGILFMYVQSTVFVHYEVFLPFFLFFFLYFLHQYTLTVTMKLRTVQIYTFG